MNTKPAYIITAAVLIVGAWMFRYELVSANDSALVFRLDRWTGDLLVAGSMGKGHVEFVKPDDKSKKATTEGWWSKDPLAE